MNEKPILNSFEDVSIAGLVTMLKLRGWSEWNLVDHLEIGLSKVLQLERGFDKGSPELRSQLERMLRDK